MVPKSYVRVPNAASMWAPGGSKSMTGRHISGPGTNASHALPMNPAPLAA